MKYWSCCSKKKTHDFDEFLAMPGCTNGVHRWFKPKEATATKCRYLCIIWCYLKLNGPGTTGSKTATLSLWQYLPRSWILLSRLSSSMKTLFERFYDRLKSLWSFSWSLISYSKAPINSRASFDSQEFVSIQSLTHCRPWSRLSIQLQL